MRQSDREQGTRDTRAGQAAAMPELWKLTRDQLAGMHTDPAIPADVRELARLEWDAKTDAISHL